MEKDSQTKKVICGLIKSANGKRFANKETYSRIDWRSTDKKRFAKKETNLRIDWWINGVSINNFVHVHPPLHLRWPIKPRHLSHMKDTQPRYSC